MALNKTKYLRKKFLDHAFGKAAYTMPGTVYLALFSADPTEEGSTANELIGSGYARVSITSLMGNAILDSGQISNSADITFPAATADWVEMTHAAIMDASSGGNMLYFGPAVTSRIVESGNTFRIQTGQLTVQER